MDFDVFNGDADGIIALHQLRLAEPRPGARLISGVKRDIDLLKRVVGQVVDQPAGRVTVLDISLDRNRAELLNLLEAGCTVFYADHHFSGDIPDHPALEAHIDPGSDVCTGLIVDRLLNGAFRGWAVAAAFGDNLHEAAGRAAAGLFGEAELACLREVGELLNYNGYGAAMEDLFFPPQEMYRAIMPFRDPLEFHARSPALAVLRRGFHDDMARAAAHPPIRETAAGRVFMLPAESWARRVAGVFSNDMARQRRDLAHGLIIPNKDGTLLISVRAPLRRKEGADRLCRLFPSGGGRAAAAGINQLPPGLLDEFLDCFEEIFQPEDPETRKDGMMAYRH